MHLSNGRTYYSSKGRSKKKLWITLVIILALIGIVTPLAVVFSQKSASPKEAEDVAHKKIIIEPLETQPEKKSPVRLPTSVESVAQERPTPTSKGPDSSHSSPTSQSKPKETDPILAAADDGNVSVLKVLVNDATIETKNGNGETTLMKAIKSKNSEAVEYLIQQNADVEAKDIKNNTPVMIAAAVGDMKILQSIMSKKANIEAVNNDGENALMIALKYGSYKYLQK